MLELIDAISSGQGPKVMVAVLLGLPRLAAVLAFCPFTAGEVFNGQMKSGLVLVLFLTLWPLIYHQTPDLPALAASDWALVALLAGKEVVVGFVLAFVSGIVFWAVQSAGFVMDNQRGASMATESDPLSGQETSPLGSLFFQTAVLAFFLGGGVLVFFRVLYESYVFWPPASFWPAFSGTGTPLFALRLVDWLQLQTVLLAGPVLAACLLADVSLGLINRFASQLNVYVLAMPIKSGLAMFMLIAYYVMLINHMPSLFSTMFEQMSFLKVLWP
ncbi:MAG: type III secretion system export apparatus subunit SctT [Deltaproteobacteria bacterium]|jgi:type III secretion protein T|nr:type III secretion system export apparatus subunit SctT [Deltaproteobacteria bacterium]